MSQDSVLKVLKKKRKWMTAKEVAAALDQGDGSVNSSLSKLFNQGVIFRRRRKLEDTTNLPSEYRSK